MGEASAKRLSKADNGDWNFGFCRSTDVSKQSAASLASDISSFSQKVPDENPHFIEHDVAIQVLHKFMSFLVIAVESSGACSVPVEVTIDILARFYAEVATVVTCLQADESEKVGRHSQKRYNGTFSSLLRIVLAQLVHQIKVYKDHWCPEEVVVFSLTIDRKEAFLRNVAAPTNSTGLYSFFKTTDHRRTLLAVLRSYY